MGLFYGLVFGVFDVEDSTPYDLQINLIQDEYSCLPVAAGLGWLGGCINEYLRYKVKIIVLRNKLTNLHYFSFKKRVEALPSVLSKIPSVRRFKEKNH